MEKIIKSSKISNSHGCDEIPTRILKASTVHTVHNSPLTYTCNEALLTGIFPTCM